MRSALSPLGVSIRVTLPAEAGIGTLRMHTPSMAAKIAVVMVRDISVLLPTSAPLGQGDRYEAEQGLTQMALRRAAFSFHQTALPFAALASLRHSRQPHRPIAQ